MSLRDKKSTFLVYKFIKMVNLKNKEIFSLLNYFTKLDGNSRIFKKIPKRTNTQFFISLR